MKRGFGFYWIQTWWDFLDFDWIRAVKYFESLGSAPDSNQVYGNDIRRFVEKKLTCYYFMTQFGIGSYILITLGLRLDLDRVLEIQGWIRIAKDNIPIISAENIGQRHRFLRNEFSAT